MKRTEIAPLNTDSIARPTSGRLPALNGRTLFLLCLPLLALFSLVMSTTSTYATGPVEYALCANEGQVCAFNGTKNVGYGVNGKMVYRNATNGLDCSNQAFGTDPAVGVRKHCVVGPQGLTYCAAEGGVCSFSGTRTVVFGTSDKFVSKVAANGIKCTSSAFGSDPRYGVKKSCYVSRH